MLILILSIESMNSDWISYEIKQTRNRKKKEVNQTLFPISVCHFEEIEQWELFDPDTVDLAAEVLSYFIPDFSNWRNPAKFSKLFERLFDSLKSSAET